MVNTFYRYHLFALDYIVVKTQEGLARMEASYLLLSIITEKQSNQSDQTKPMGRISDSMTVPTYRLIY